MKHKTFISLIALLLLAPISLIGCNDNGGGGSSQGTQALTEHDFANNPSLQADPDNQIIVDFLESPSSDTPQYDTGEVGIDEIPLTYPQTETHTFCWTDDNSEAMDYMRLLDSQGEEVLRVDVNGDCVTDTIEAGDYVMELHHDNSTGDPLPIFIIPNPDQNQQAMKTDGLFNGFKVVVAKILRGIQNTISKDARAQTVQENINTLLSTYSCTGCFLVGADLTGEDLRGVDLTRAILVQANLTSTNFTGANLTGADLSALRNPTILTSANFTRATLVGADLSGTAGFGANFNNANLTNTNMTGAFLANAVFTNANFTAAILYEANLYASDLTGAYLRNVDARHAYFYAASFHNVTTEFSGTRFRHANMDHVDFTGLDDQGQSDFRYVSLRFTDFTNAYIVTTHFQHSDFTGAKLTGSIRSEPFVLRGPEFAFATWCNGRCVCQPPSEGNCDGCGSIANACNGS
jgi:uncharacterized protein YjbI with pentapeptide repeats